jgi:hypothetical protein
MKDKRLHLRWSPATTYQDSSNIRPSLNRRPRSSQDEQVPSLPLASLSYPASRTRSRKPRCTNLHSRPDDPNKRSLKPRSRPPMLSPRAPNSLFSPLHPPNSRHLTSFTLSRLKAVHESHTRTSPGNYESSHPPELEHSTRAKRVWVGGHITTTADTSSVRTRTSGSGGLSMGAKPG